MISRNPGLWVDILKAVVSNPTPDQLFCVIKLLNAVLRGGVCVHTHRGSTVGARGDEILDIAE